MYKLLPLLVCMLSASAYSQYTISGKVMDEKSKPAKSISMLLLKHADSSLVRSVLSSADGKFAFAQVNTGKYFVVASATGYNRKFQAVEVKQDLQLDDIHLTEFTNTLQNVTVTASKPFLEQRADKLVVNIEGSGTSAGSTALEILQKVPGVIVMNDNIKLAGKSNVMIMIDGRPSQYTDMNQVLRDMSAANIEKIELITNPSAKYDAAGGAIINIILKKNANLGTNGNISLSSGVGLYDRSKEGLDRTFYRVAPSVYINHRKGKWNVYGSYSFLNRTYFTIMEIDRQFAGYRFSQRNYEPADVRSHNLRLGADFYADKKNTFGVLVRGFNRTGDNNQTGFTEQINSAGQVISQFQTQNNQSQDRSNIAANANWKHYFDSLGHELNMDIDYSSFQIDNTSNILTKAGTSYANRQVVDNPVKFIVGKLDYSRPLGKDTKLDMGFKTSNARIDNFLKFYRQETLDNGKSNDFLYQENINASYLNFSKKMTGWEVMAGIRAEQTIAKGTSNNVKNLDRNYLQWFPSAFITKNIDKNMALNLQYSRRVNRPSYQQQNPFTFYLDSLTYTRGNPLLSPEITNSVKLALTYQGQPFFSISRNVTTDVIFGDAPKQEGNITYTTPENLAKFENYVVELNFPIKFGKKVSGYGGNQAIWNHYKAAYLGGIYDRARWNWLAYWQVSYKPTTSWNFEIGGFYMTKSLEEFIAVHPLGNLNIAVQRFFWERKGRLTLNVSDVFYSGNSKADIVYQDINVRFAQRRESRTLRLTFSYSFGNQKLKAARNRSTGSDTETERVKI